MTEEIPSREACCSTYLSPKAVYIINGTFGIKAVSQEDCWRKIAVTLIDGGAIDQSRQLFTTPLRIESERAGHL